MQNLPYICAVSFFMVSLISVSYAQPSAMIQAPQTATSYLAPTVDFKIMATAHSPAQPINAFLKDWDAPLTSGQYAYAQSRAELTVHPSDSPIHYGLGWRYDYLMKFNEETAKLYWQYKNKQLANKTASYSLELAAKHNERFGANIGITKDLTPNWQLTTSANLWRGIHVLEGKAAGTLTTQAMPDSENIRNLDRLDKTFTSLDYFYDKPALVEEDLNWFPEKPTGYGYSLDTQLTGKLSDKTILRIEGYDIFGKMHWYDAPSTRYLLDYDSNRRPNDKSEGDLTLNNEVQDLSWRVESHLTHDLNQDWQLGVHGQANELHNIFQLSASYHTDYQDYPMMISGIVEPQTKAIGIALDSQLGGIKFMADDLNSEKAKRAEISLYGRYTW